MLKRKDAVEIYERNFGRGLDECRDAARCADSFIKQHDALLEIYHLLGGEGEPEDVVEACKNLAKKSARNSNPMRATPSDIERQRGELIAYGSGDGYWVRAEDLSLRPDKAKFTEAFYAAPSESSATGQATGSLPCVHQSGPASTPARSAEPQEPDQCSMCGGIGEHALSCAWHEKVGEPQERETPRTVAKPMTLIECAEVMSGDDAFAITAQNARFRDVQGARAICSFCNRPVSRIADWLPSYHICEPCFSAAFKFSRRLANTARELSQAREQIAEKDREIAAQDVQMDAVRYRAERAEQQIAEYKDSLQAFIDLDSENALIAMDGYSSELVLAIDVAKRMLSASHKVTP